MKRPFSFLIAFFAIGLLCAQNIPENPNKKDSFAKRQGKWTVLFGMDWNPVTSIDSVKFYRVIEYKDDKPVGVTTDFYLNGVHQWEGTLLEDRPEDIFDYSKPFHFYNEDGSENLRSTYNELAFHFEEERNYEQAIFYRERAAEVIKKDLGHDTKEYATAVLDIGYDYKNRGLYEKALPYYMEAKEVREKVLGKKHPQYASILNSLGVLYDDMEKYDEAELAYRQANEIRDKYIGNKDLDYATTLRNLAIIMRIKLKYAEAEKMAIAAKDVVEKLVGKNNADFASSLATLADIYRKMKKFGEAQPLYEESLEIRKKLFGINLSYATSLNSLGILYDDMGNDVMAEKYYREAKDIREKIVGKDNLTYASSAHNLAGVYKELGDFTKSDLLYTEAASIRKKLLGADNYDYASTLNSHANLYTELGRFSEAETLYLLVKDIWAKIKGDKSDEYALVLNNLAGLYDEMGSYSRAEALYLESKAIREQVLGKGHYRYAESLNALGLLYLHLGNFTKAESYFLEARDRREKIFGKENSSYATSLNNLSLLYAKMGNTPKALALNLEAKEIYKATTGKLSDLYARSVNNLAAIYYKMHEYEEAERLYLESKDIREQTLGKNTQEYALVIDNLAVLYNDTYKYEKAEAFYIEAIEIYARTLGKNHQLYAVALNNLATFYVDTRKYDKAEPLILESKDIRERVLGKDHSDYSLAVINLATFYNSVGNYQKAEAFFIEASSLKAKEISRYFLALSEQEKKEYYAANKTYFARFENFCLTRYRQSPAIASELFNLRLITKGILFNNSNKMRQHIMESNDKSLIDKFAQWKEKKDFLAKVYQMPKAEKLSKRIDEKKLEEEVNTIEKELSLQSEVFANQSEGKLYTWRDVQRQLKQGEAAVEIIQTDFGLAALIVSQETKDWPLLVKFENSYQLEYEYVKYYRNAVMRQVPDEFSYDKFWKPIANALAGIKKVYFSPDGVFNQINLNTLLNVSTGKYVIDELDIQLVLSTKELLRKTKLNRAQVLDITLFGFPNYNLLSIQSKRVNSQSVPSRSVHIAKDTTQRFLNGEKINELPGTKVEVETIESLLKAKSIGVKKFIFNDATEDEIKKINNPKVLHIATHGFFLSDLPWDSKKERGIAGMEASKISEDPLFRSGLIFAGAVNAFRADEQMDTRGEDGILFAYEAMNLKLDQTDLVVMSACETGLGLASNGEGVYGLQRAFQTAGAKSVLMSLWSVSDEATQELMTAFYTNWVNGSGLRDAFRKAQFAIRKKFPDPYFWGAFVMVGQ